MANIGIKNGWSLLEFAAAKGKMQVGNFVNKDTGESFKSCIFGGTCFVSFSSKLGELTPAQIAARKHELRVVELESGNYKLCEQGESTWEDVEL